MPTLLAISNDMLALEQAIGEAAGDGGDITEAETALNAWFAELNDQHEAKLDGYASYIRELELRSAARKEEAERLARRAKIDQAQADFLRARLKEHFEAHGIAKVETSRFRLSVASNGGKLPLVVSEEDPKRLPAQFQRTVTTVTADTDAIRTWLEAGDELPFASLGPRGTQLRIR